ncbi:hypothetical protein [Paracoccus rhizosphaerae]|uniref:Uncharacterized protein n=1 Tax=Paracoccus rhizosphaerae TaxID=1133347 RepID=A0ABV6CS78_9RHOB|nr:hypothetical protein [Paracoccus rhizosphaerae]
MQRLASWLLRRCAIDADLRKMEKPRPTLPQQPVAVQVMTRHSMGGVIQHVVEEETKALDTNSDWPGYVAVNVPAEFELCIHSQLII